MSHLAMLIFCDCTTYQYLGFSLVKFDSRPQSYQIYDSLSSVLGSPIGQSNLGFNWSITRLCLQPILPFSFPDSISSYWQVCVSAQFFASLPVVVK